MSHDMQAAWAASEIAHLFTVKQDIISNGLGAAGGWSFYASREGKREWPIADGVIVAENRTVQPLKIALEYKRLNEGLHGVLTALGQSLSYLEKGFNGSVIVIPKEYESHKTPGEHISRVLQQTAPSMPVSVYTYQWQHEPCLYGWKKKGKHQWYTGRKESTIWEFDKPKKNGDHPTMKPIPLLAYPIQNSSMANSVVLDPFGGSGSTLIACEQTDRICCTIELDEKFCDVIVRRYIEQVGTDEKVGVLRDGKVLPFTEVANTAPEV